MDGDPGDDFRPEQITRSRIELSPQ